MSDETLRLILDLIRLLARLREGYEIAQSIPANIIRGLVDEILKDVDVRDEIREIRSLISKLRDVTRSNS